MPKSKKGDNSVKCLENSANTHVVNQAIYTLTICKPNIMTIAQAVLQILCSQGPLWVKCLSPKRKIIQSNFDRILWKVNQVIYIMYSNCMPYMILAVLKVFCSQGPLWVKCLSLKRGIIQSNFDRILWKVNQVIYIMYPNCMPDIMILAQAVLQTFCSQGCFTTQNDNVGKGR